MKQILVVAMSLFMFFAVGIQLDFGDDVEMPEWVEDLMSEDKGSMIDMTHHPLYIIARTRFTSGYDDPASDRH